MSVNPGLISVLVLAAVHLLADRTKIVGWIWHGRFLSFAAGISFAYVFIDLLPALAKGEPALRRTFEGITPYFDRHPYLIALLGMLFFYGIHSSSEQYSKGSFWASTSGSILFNFFMGASLYDSKDPELQPLALFTIAMGMHYFIQDHYTSLKSPELYRSKAKWILVIALFAGYLVGWKTKIPDSVAAVAISFLAGGVFLNVLHYELPKKERGSYPFFVLGSILYTIILVSLGE